MRCSSVRLTLALVVGLPVAPALFAQGGSIAGVVVSRSSGAPIGDVQVTVTGTPERVFTDVRGRFRFDDLAGTTVVLQVRRIGFRGVTDTVNVGDTNLRVALEQKVLELSQVVVTGTSSATEIGRVGNAVSRINADDIESIEILKGPAATTLYGTEASSGVMQVITKQGTPGPARWNLIVRRGANFLSNPEGRFPTNYQRDALGNIISVNMRDLESQLGGSIFRTGHAADYQLSVSGGSSAVRYYAAGGTELQGGAEPNNDIRHTTGRANLTITPSDKVTLSARVGYVSGPTHLSAEAGFGGRIWSTVLADPRNLGTPQLGFFSGLPPEYDEVYHFTQDLDRFTGSVQLQHHPVKWFTHRVTFGVDRTREVNTLYQPRIDSLVANPTFGSDALGFISIENHNVDYTT